MGNDYISLGEIPSGHYFVGTVKHFTIRDYCMSSNEIIAEAEALLLRDKEK